MSYATRWLFSTSHKDIAILYLIYGMIASMVATGMSVLIRMELASGNSQFFHENHQAFNVIVTGHAIAMIFLFVMPVLIGAFGKIINYKIYPLILHLIYILNIFIIQYLYLYYLLLNNNRTITSPVDNVDGIDNISPADNVGGTCHDTNNKLSYNNSFDNISDNLCIYLTGLIERNGNIYLDKNNKISPKILIVFNKKDYELIKYLINKFKIGNIIDKSNVYIWQIKNIEDIYKLIKYTNGYYRTFKYKLICKIINWINNYIDKPSDKLIKNNYNIYNNNIRNNILSKINYLEIKPLDKSNILSNAWLTGFTDTNNKFNIILNKSRNNKSISLKYSLEIKENIIFNSPVDIVDGTSYLNNSLYPIMLNISNSFNTSINNKNKNINLLKVCYTYIISINNNIKLIKVINYFNKYPLLSSKYLDYQNWYSLYLFIKNNNYTNSHIEVIKLGTYLRSNMNKNRKIFNWKHLYNNNIYN